MKTFCKLVLILMGAAVPFVLHAQLASFDADCAYSTNAAPYTKIMYATMTQHATVTVTDFNDTNNDLVSGADRTVHMGKVIATNTPDLMAYHLLTYFGYACGRYHPGADLPGTPENSVAIYVGEVINESIDGTLDYNAVGIASLTETHTGTSFGVSLVVTNDTTSTAFTVTCGLSDAYVTNSEADDGKDHGPCDCNGQPDGFTGGPSTVDGASGGDANDTVYGMPKWFITEPFMNLWVKDSPVFYYTSLGSKLDFRVAYKQHDTRPLDTAVPPTGWSHNWYSYIHFVVPTFLSSTSNSGSGISMPGATGPVAIRTGWVFTNDFSQWQAILYTTDDGESYFTHDQETESQSGLVLTALDGVNAHVYPYSAENPDGSTSVAGFKLVHPDGSVDEYTSISAAKFSFGLSRRNGRVYDLGAKPPRLASFGSLTYYDKGTNNYEEDPNDATAAAPVGQQVGYLACDAVLTRRTDRYGNACSLAYTQSGGKYYLHTITDYDGRVTTLAYDGSAVASVSMPYGKSAGFVYNTDGQLTQITDAQGMSSSFAYDEFPYTDESGPGTNIYLSSITTPYGTTSFSHYEAPPLVVISNPPALYREVHSGVVSYVPRQSGTSMLRVGWFGGTNRVNKACTITHPDGSQELYVYRYDSRNLVPSNYPAGEIPSDAYGAIDDGSDLGGDSDADPVGIEHLLSSRNSFHWNRQQYAALSTSDYNHFTANDYALATMKHWLENDAVQTFYPQAVEANVSDQLSLVREASPDGSLSGAKTWFDYGGKPTRWQAGDDSSTLASTLLPDGSVRSKQTTYSDGLLSQVSDSYTLADGSQGTRTAYYTFDMANHRIYSIAPWVGYLNFDYPNDLEMDVSDAQGGVTSYFYNSRHQITGIKHANGLTTTNFYGSDGFLAKSIDLEARATNTYTFANGLPTTRITPLGQTLNYSWDKLDRLTGVGFADGTTVSNIFDKLNLVAHKDRLNHWTYASYDSMRQPSSSTDANGGTTYYSYCFCGGLASITDPLGNSTAFTRDYDGNVTQATSSDGFSTSYNRNLVGQATSITTSAGSSLNYTYNNQGLVTNVSSSVGTVFTAVYDEGDRPVQITDARGVTITNAFDTLDRLTDRWNAFGRVVHNDYSAQGVYQSFDALSHMTSYGYDPAGRLAAITDANGNTNGFTYNPLGQLASLADGNGHVTSWAYDINGRNIAKTDGNNVLIETNGYDAAGRLTAHWTPAKGLTTYAKDANGNVTGITYSSGPGITAGYDGLNRITSLGDAVGTHTFTYTNFGAFDGALKTEDGPWASDTVTYGYNQRVPQSLALAQPSGTWSESFGYDGLLRLHTVASDAGTFTYTYNGAGQQIQGLTLPGGNSIARTYDAAGRLLATALQHGSTVLDAQAYTYDANGSRTSVTRADNAVVNYGYDAIGQLVSAVGQEAGGLLRGNENFSYGYDPAGNLQMRTNNTLIQCFNTDNANELVNITRNNDLLTVAGSLNGSNNFTVNGVGATIYNDLTFAVTNGVSIANGLNILNTVVTSNSVTMTNKTVEFLPATVNLGYDANGNLVSDRLHGYDYDCANQLTRITVTNILKAEFAYDGFGRRCIRKEFTWQTNQWLETNEVHYVYDGMLVIQERDSNNVPKVSYTRGVDLSGSMQGAGGIGGLLARTDGSGSAFYHADGNGNITMLIDSSGNQLAKYLYDPYGNTLGMWGTLASANTYRFSSKEFDLTAGLYYYGYRYYQPNLQRWLNRDPIEEQGGINLYTFLNNDIVNEIDKLGLQGWVKISPHNNGVLDPNSTGPVFQIASPTVWTATQPILPPSMTGSPSVSWADVQPPPPSITDTTPVGALPVPGALTMSKNPNPYNIAPTELLNNIAAGLAQADEARKAGSRFLSQCEKTGNAWKNPFGPGPTSPLMATLGLACEIPQNDMANIGANFFEGMQDSPNTKNPFQVLDDALESQGPKIEDELNKNIPKALIKAYAH